MDPVVASLVTALSFAAVLLFGWRPAAVLGASSRGFVSASAGATVAYVFVYLLPELSEAGAGFVEATKGQGLPLPEYRLYSVALAGFVVFYGLEHLRVWSRQASAAGPEHRELRTFRLHIGGYAAYMVLVSVTMGEMASGVPIAFVLYAVAIGLHLFGTAGELAREHGERYQSAGRYVLAAAVLGGWAVGAFAPESPAAKFTLLGFVSGGVVMNSMIMELPREKNGRFWPFLIGAIGYALLLLVLARLKVGA